MVLNVQSLEPDEFESQAFVMDELADAAAARGEDVIKLTLGVSDLPPPRRVLDALAAGAHDLGPVRQVYPEGLPALREAIARYHNERFGAGTDAAHVVVHTGTGPLLRDLFGLLCRRGQQVLLPRPYSGLYRVCARLAGARVAYYDIDLLTGRVDLPRFRRAFDPERTAVVVINNPGNPAGNLLTRDEVEEIYATVADRAYVINDEVYNNCCFYEPFVSPLSYLPGPARRVSVVTNSLSKGFRLYTRRVGWAILPDELLLPMRIVQQHTLLTHDPLIQRAAIEALEDPGPPRELTAVHRARAEYALDRLAGTLARPVRPEGGFSVVLDCSAWLLCGRSADTVELARDLLACAGVAAVPGTDFGAPSALRLSLCSARFEEGIDRLRDYFTAPAPRAVRRPCYAEQWAG